jgi:hypothetical protein
MENNEAKYQHLSSLNCEEIELHFTNKMNIIGKSMYQLKNANSTILQQLEEIYNDNDNKDNISFDELERIEYELDAFVYYYKNIKKHIAAARLAKLVIQEKTNSNVNDNTNIPEELLALGCKKIQMKTAQ